MIKWGLFQEFKAGLTFENQSSHHINRLEKESKSEKKTKKEKYNHVHSYRKITVRIQY